MEFHSDHIDEFKSLFESKKTRIEAFPGCIDVALLRDHGLPHVLYTLSHWDSADALENYRTSDFFDETWAATKRLFSGKPNAWSLISES